MVNSVNFNESHQIEKQKECLEVLAQQANVEIVRSDVMTQVRIRNLTVVCEFNFSGLSLLLRPKKKTKGVNTFFIC
jgi:hypothetical protein